MFLKYCSQITFRLSRNLGHTLCHRNLSWDDQSQPFVKVVSPEVGVEGECTLSVSDVAANYVVGLVASSGKKSSAMQKQTDHHKLGFPQQPLPLLPPGFLSLRKEDILPGLFPQTPVSGYYWLCSTDVAYKVVSPSCGLPCRLAHSRGIHSVTLLVHPDITFVCT